MNKQYISNDLADKTLHLKLMNMRKSIILLAFTDRFKEHY